MAGPTVIARDAASRAAGRKPLILGFDTSAAHCAAALVCGDRCIAACSEEMARGQAERLMPLIEELLAAEGLGWRDLSGLGVGIGPGNFTGIRIAVAAARGLALALGIPAAGVTRFETLAAGLPRPLVVAEDARRDEIYLQVFGDDGVEDRPPELLPRDGLDPEALEAIAGLPLVGSAAAGIAARSGGTCLPPALPPAEAIARIASARIAEAQGGALPRPAPLYLRPADAAPSSEPPPVMLP